jgi:hypothetical protein
MRQFDHKRTFRSVPVPTQTPKTFPERLALAIAIELEGHCYSARALAVAAADNQLNSPGSNARHFPAHRWRNAFNSLISRFNSLFRFLGNLLLTL